MYEMWNSIHVALHEILFEKIVLLLKIPMETSGLGFQGHSELRLSKFTYSLTKIAPLVTLFCVRLEEFIMLPNTQEEMNQLMVCMVVGAHPFHQSLAWLSGAQNYGLCWPFSTILFDGIKVERAIYLQSKPAHSPLALPDGLLCV